MEAQEQSRFFNLPLEVRRATYAYLVPNAIHAFVRQGNVVLSPCIEPEIAGTRMRLGIERRPVEDKHSVCGKRSSEDVWARRLQSSWGPHWQCEEIAQGPTLPRSDDRSYQEKYGAGDHNATMSMLLVCKRIYVDVAKVLVSDVTFHVTDLETLDHLAQSNSGSQTLSSPYRILFTKAPLLRRLHITLRFSLPLFRAIAILAAVPTSSDCPKTGHVNMPPFHTSVSECDGARKWLQVRPALARRLQGLQNLHLWLDHDESASWSLVNERAVVSSILASMSPDMIPGLGTATVNLPMLHPRYEVPDRHYMGGKAQPPAFALIDRRLRQNHFYEETDSGAGSVTYAPDFPAMFELCEYTADSDFGPAMSPEQVEEMERDSWARGVDPEDDIWELAPWQGPGARTLPPFSLSCW